MGAVAARRAAVEPDHEDVVGREQHRPGARSAPLSVALPPGRLPIAEALIEEQHDRQHHPEHAEHHEVPEQPQRVPERPQRGAETGDPAPAATWWRSSRDRHRRRRGRRAASPPRGGRGGCLRDSSIGPRLELGVGLTAQPRGQAARGRAVELVGTLRGTLRRARLPRPAYVEPPPRRRAWRAARGGRGLPLSLRGIGHRCGGRRNPETGCL